ncbi:hypothetical protein [Methylobacterium sp. CM6257]|jgi:hypothetical protein
MSTANTHSEEAVAGLNRRIVEAEMRSTAAADALAALTRTEGDTAEAEQRLNEEMDALWVLRRQLWELRASEGA